MYTKPFYISFFFAAVLNLPYFPIKGVYTFSNFERTRVAVKVCISGDEQVVSKFFSLVCAHNSGICHGSAAFSSLNIEFP